MDRAVGAYPLSPELVGVRNIDNVLLFIDDDMREAAVAITRIEDYLRRTLARLEQRTVARAELTGLAEDRSVLDDVDHLSETVESLRRRLSGLAANLRR